MQKRVLWSAMLSVGLLAACGGGGGGGAEPAPPAAASIDIDGVASKGLMAGAVVTVHAVNADGTVGDALATSPAEVVTSATGQYSLSFSGAKDRPYVVKVTARAGTTHVDEVASAQAGAPTAQALPVGFSMRSVVVPPASGTQTISASVTPFSEMAVAAAERASGGLTTGNTTQAVASVSQLLGFNPITVAATPLADASTPEQQKLAVMLAAVSQLAGTDALGCTTGGAGDKTQCVVEKLASAASATSIKLSTTDGSGTTDVSAALGAALADVLADADLRGNVDPSLLAGIDGNLGCSGDACHAAPAPGVDSAATAIASAKALFANIKSDWSSLFIADGASSVATGAAEAELFKFREAMSGVQVPAETLVKDASTLLMGVDLYNDYIAGRETMPTRGRGEGTVAGFDASNMNGAGCSLYQDQANTLLATSPANALYIGCRALFYATRQIVGTSTATTEWRHGFTLTPTGNDGFDYTSRARRRVTSCTNGACTTTANESLQASGYAGTVATTLTAGHITGFTIEGQLPGAFTSGGNTLVNERHTWSLTGTRSIDAQDMSSTAFSGQLVAYDAAGAVEGTLTVVSGSTSETPVSRDASFNEVKPGSATAVAPYGGMLSALTLNLKWATAGAELEGTLSGTDSVWDASGASLLPTKMTLAGTLRNIESGTAREFISGTLNLTLAGHAGYDAQQADSASNFNTVGLSFVGKVTAPGRPVLELTMSSSVNSHEGRPAAASLQYRSLVNGTPRTVISVAGTRGNDGRMSYSLTEATSNLSMGWADGAASSELKWGTTTIGVLSRSANGVTFTNGEFMSIDIGL